MAGATTELPFTQEDRDMLRDTSRDVKQILSSMEVRNGETKALELRIEMLEKWQARVIAACTLVSGALGLLAAHTWK